MKDEYIVIYAVVPRYIYETKELTPEEEALLLFYENEVRGHFGGATTGVCKELYVESSIA